MYRCDVWMVECSQRRRFALESAKAIRVARHLLRQHFDGDVSIEPFVMRAEDHTHPARADFLDDAVVAEGLTDEVWHRLWFLRVW